MKPSKHHLPASAITSFLCHFSLWFGLVFATPLFIALNNQGELDISASTFASWAALICLALSMLSWKASCSHTGHFQWWASRIMLTVAIVLAIQGNVIQGLFDYGVFNGQSINFRDTGWKFRAEWLGWLAAFPLLFWLLSRLHRLPAWLPLIPVFSFSFLLLPSLLEQRNEEIQLSREAEVDDSVFAFSSVSNLIHLLPDGFQGDVVRQVFEEQPGLANKFRGFTLFTDHVGLYQGTAPAIFTILTGSEFEFERGLSYEWFIPEIEKNRYQNELVKLGYQLDLVPISGFTCPREANSCHVRPFYDLKTRGYFRDRAEETRYSLRLITDLTLFRLLPMFLKEKVHNEGRWLFADTAQDGFSPWLDPVMREWSEKLHVIDDRPVYKWYHYIGTHMPASWDAQCRRRADPGRQREDYLEQAFCLLSSLGNFLDQLHEAGIYDQTAFVINGDHGHSTPPDDLVSSPFNSSLSAGLAGSGRPALLVKQKHKREPLRFSQLPTSLLDVAPTALHLAGLDTEGHSVFELSAGKERNRYFKPYSIADFYSGDPIPYIEYRVGQPASDLQQWAVSNIQNYGEIPGGYDPVNQHNANGYILGARLTKSTEPDAASWVTGRQLAFVIDLPDPLTAGTLEMNLHLPGWIPEQSFTVQLNNGAIWHSPRLTPADRFWQSISIPMEKDQILAGTNFVSVVFDQLYKPPDGEAWVTPGFIRSITVSGDTGQN